MILAKARCFASILKLGQWRVLDLERLPLLLVCCNGRRRKKMRWMCVKDTLHGNAPLGDPCEDLWHNSIAQLGTYRAAADDGTAVAYVLLAGTNGQRNVMTHLLANPRKKQARRGFWWFW